MSIRIGDRIFITRRGSMLGCLREEDIVETGLEQDDEGTALASRELEVHRAIYRVTSAQAVLHAHPPYSIVLSMTRKEIVPVDAEGAYLLGKVPVVTVKESIGSPEVAEKLPGFLKEYKIALVHAHGSFAIGESLEEAYHWTSCMEASSKIIYLLQKMGYTSSK